MLTQTPFCTFIVAVDKRSAGKPWHTPARPNAVSERLGERQAQGETHAEKARAAEHAAKGSVVKPSRFPHPDDGIQLAGSARQPGGRNARALEQQPTPPGKSRSVGVGNALTGAWPVTGCMSACMHACAVACRRVCPRRPRASARGPAYMAMGDVARTRHVTQRTPAPRSRGEASNQGIPREDPP